MCGLSKRTFFRRMRGRNVPSVHPVGKTTIVDVSSSFPGCMRQLFHGREKGGETKDSTDISIGILWNSPTSTRDKGQG